MAEGATKAKRKKQKSHSTKDDLKELDKLSNRLVKYTRKYNAEKIKEILPILLKTDATISLLKRTDLGRRVATLKQKTDATKFPKIESTCEKIIKRWKAQVHTENKKKQSARKKRARPLSKSVSKSPSPHSLVPLRSVPSHSRTTTRSRRGRKKRKTEIKKSGLDPYGS